MTEDERKALIHQLYWSMNEARLEIEANMDSLIQKGLTDKMSAPLLTIMETTARLMRGPKSVNGDFSTHKTG
jgi:hypothetical protein